MSTPGHPPQPAWYSLLNGDNAGFLEHLYRHQQNGDSATDPAWQHLLDETAAARRANNGVAGPVSLLPDNSAHKQQAVQDLIEAYRHRGHLIASLDPLGLTPIPEVPELKFPNPSLDESDLDKVFLSGGMAAGERLPLSVILDILRHTYSGPVGVEYSHLTDINEVHWLQSRLETNPVRPPLPVAERHQLLQRITAAEGLEHYLHTRYTGQKRFSLEGGECLVPMLNDLIQHCGKLGAKEIVIGMAHRGRLNVLVNILGKSPVELFDEFEGRHQANDNASAGDVKYHQGFSSDITTPGGPVHLALSFNPSHLEIINPVVQGSVRARQHRRGDHEFKCVVPLLVHGDAAFAGQGVVMETINMSQARSFAIGGTFHIVVNNQIGFTTSHPLDARSTLYCTEVAKLVQAPIFHVNGDDPDAVIFATRLALEYRMHFHKDVVVDLVCYRRHGHNEADEPAVTQPMMYRTIRKHPSSRQLYAQRLADEGVVDAQQAEAMVEEYRESLEKDNVMAGQLVDQEKKMIDWTPYIKTTWDQSADTAVSKERIKELNRRMQVLPDNFVLHSRIQKIMDGRIAMAGGELPIDWGFAENMAYASLIEDGFKVRLSGQDTGRGTFFHRHAIVHNQNNREIFTPLHRVNDDPSSATVINSLLSEEAVLGFEYGYSTTDPDMLVVWEAQFGDFANGAQVVIDQFISSGEAKWGRLSGLTMLLPHGYEGQGPEHSSARIERYLQLCALYNMQVCVPSTPAQMFHLLRRQMRRPFRRPLVVMSPKSLLRHKQSTSTLDELSAGKFHHLILDHTVRDPGRVVRVVLCTGKVYYDLCERRDALNLDNTAIIRIEQLYPFPVEELTAAIATNPNVEEVVWCQEEPQNQGVWHQSRHHFIECILPKQQLRYAGRQAAPSPAAGFYSLHIEQQKQLVEDALNPDQSVRTQANS